MNIKLPKLPKNKKIGKKGIIIIAVVFLLVAAFIGAKIFMAKKAASGADTGFAEYTVSKGDIAVVISGSGTIEANEQYEITALVTGDVLSADFEEGDQVEEGDILYQIDTENVENSIERAKNSLESAKMSYDDALEQVENLNVSANCSGVITQVYIKAGDSVGKGAKIADVVDDSEMILKIPFNANDADNLYAGQSITVRLDASGYELPGRISRVSSGATSSSTGVSVKNVEIRVVNPGTLKKGEKAIAYTSQYACNEAGTFEVLAEKTITALASGDVDAVLIGEGDQVKKGQIVANLSSKSVRDSARKSSLSYDDARLNLENLYEGMEDYTITSPISGTVISKTTKAGDKLDNTNRSTTMAVIADMSRMLFQILVDELDIAKLEVNQKVAITADALEGRIFSGYIDKISIIGSTSNGVTTYPVTVVVEEPDGLIPGMNVDATITVQEAKDVVAVPVSAIMRGNMVAVKSNGKTPAANTEEKMPQMPEGNGERPQMPEGGWQKGEGNSERPQMPEGGWQRGEGNGERPQMPEGAKQKSEEDKSTNKADSVKQTAEADKKTQGNKGNGIQKQSGDRNMTMPGGNKAFGKDLPEGFELRRVEIGISNSDSVEIISGLEEGDIILIQQIAGASAGNMMMGGMGAVGRMHMSGMGGMPMGGGMPAGAMGGMGGNRSGNMSGGRR